MKVLTTRSVNYLELRGHGFWKQTLLLSFLDVFFGAVSTTIRDPSFSPLILKRRQKPLRLISLKIN